MKLRTKLVLAFLLLAVFPLAVITVYSYYSSIGAFRKAVEAEAGALAEEMGRRMDSVRRELGDRVGRLGGFPFRRLMASRGEKFDLQANPLMAALLAEVGDAAALLDSIEFRPARPVRPSLAKPSASRPRRPVLPKPTEAGRKEPEGLVIHLSPNSAGVPASTQPVTVEARRAGVMMHIMPILERQLRGLEHKPLPASEKKKVEEELKKIRQFQIVLQDVQNKKTAEQVAQIPRDGEKQANQVAQVQLSNPLARNFGQVVRADGEPVGTVEALASPSQIFQEVLSRTRRRQGETPFVVDSNGKVYTTDPADQSEIQTLILSTSASEKSGQAEVRELKDWVVVTRQDPQSNLTFGIARPIAAALQEIRNTAVRNLGYGLAVVALALVGIIPLSNRMTRNLQVLTDGAEKLARGHLDTRVSVSSRDEIGRLAATFNRMAHDLGENQERVVEQERLRKELEMSRRIQEELLPRAPLRAGLVEAKGLSIPAREVGGDFFNYFPLPGGNVSILVGDVSGKGIAAALLMANLQATLQARLPLISDLEQLAKHLDQEIESTTPPEVYLALFMGILDTKSNLLRYVNAGHHTQYALRSTGVIERLKSSGRPLGLLAGGEYTECRIQMAEQDALFLYTDGLVEAEDSAGREFGQERLEALLIQERESGISEILTRIEDEVRKHRGENEATDDATMVVLRIGVVGQEGVTNKPSDL